MQQHPLVQQGTRIGGRYEIARAIGRGGVGCVFEARHLELNKLFALKLIRLDHWSDNALRRFRREAQALARIDSPRVVQVTDFGVDETVGPYLVMEYLRRQTLREYLETTPRPALSVVKTIAEQTGKALADIHETGLLHRDIKPSNIAIALDEPIVVKLIDLGLAIDHGSDAKSRVTASHEMVGSMPYMAPELFSGGSESVASDCWSLGVVLAEMLRGAPPFDAPSSAALIHQITSSPLPALPDATPQALSDALAALLERDPSRRTKDPRHVFDGAAASASSGARASRPRVPWVAIASLAAVGLTVGVGVATQTKVGRSPDSRTDVVTETAAHSTTPPVVGQEPAGEPEGPKPDGKALAEAQDLAQAHQPANDNAVTTKTRTQSTQADGARKKRRKRAPETQNTIAAKAGQAQTRTKSSDSEHDSEPRFAPKPEPEQKQPATVGVRRSNDEEKRNWYGEVIDEF